MAALIALTDDHLRAYTSDISIEGIRRAGCDVPRQIASAANRLDLYYLVSRYPDSLGGADPSKVLQKRHAALALEQARSVFDYGADFVGKLKEKSAPPE